MSEPIEWTCGDCGEQTVVRHYLQRGGVIVHDPDLALREVMGLDKPEPTPPDCNGANT